jgi:LuxR family maltose regulon positive regulatory protein
MSETLQSRTQEQDRAPKGDVQSASAPGPVLLSTKLHVPIAAHELVSRQRLLTTLDRATESKVTLVAAPPGWGKSTLVSEWCAQHDLKESCAWISLDEADNDPVRFWSYVVEALHAYIPRPTTTAHALLRAPGTGIVQDVLPTILNGLDEYQGRIIIVLDDYHEIRNVSIHEQIAYLVRHLPHAVRLVLVTRNDPPLPLSRLRAGRELTEIRVDELRFSEAETHALLHEVLHIDVYPEDASSLHRRTEGWVAGLQLAALSLRNRPDVGAYIAEFAGDDRHIVDFLVSEVLAGQPEGVRNFLLRTSILRRLCGDLCDAVLDHEGSAQMLANLERMNLFLVPLDPRRRWYRYHQLFGELLRFELGREEPTVVPQLHLRAARWHLDHGYTAAAIHHTTAAGSYSEAGNLITRHWYEFLQEGRLETVNGWLGALPDHILENDARLCLIKAWIAVNTGQLEEVDRWTRTAEQIAVERRGEEAAVLESGVVNLRAIHRYMAGNMEEAVAAGNLALQLDARLEHSPWHPVGCPVLGVALFWSGRSGDAEEELTRAVHEAEIGGNNLSKLHALGGLAAIKAEQGDFEQAGDIAVGAMRFGDDRGLSEHWATTLALAVHGKTLERRGELDEAEAAVRRGVELSHRGVASMEKAYALLIAAQLRRRRGDASGFRALQEQARDEIHRCADPGILPGLLPTATRSRRSAAPGGAPTSQHLTERELAILKLLRGRLSQREIAEELYVSHNTVKTHMRSLYRKLDVSSREEALAKADELGLRP